MRKIVVIQPLELSSIALNYLGMRVQNVLNASTFLREIDGTGDDSHTLAIRVPARFPTTGFRWALGGYLVGTWWSLLAAALHRTISSLAIRQIVDRARTPKRYVGFCLHLRSFAFFSFLHLFLIFLLSSSLNPRRSLPRSDNPLSSLSSSSSSPPSPLSLLYIDKSRIKKGTCDHLLGFIREDATSDRRAEWNRDLYCDRYWPLQKRLSFSSMSTKKYEPRIL